MDKVSCFNLYQIYFIFHRDYFFFDGRYFLFHRDYFLLYGGYFLLYGGYFYFYGGYFLFYGRYLHFYGDCFYFYEACFLLYGGCLLFVGVIYSNLTGFRKPVRFNDRLNNVASHFTSSSIRKANCNEYTMIQLIIIALRSTLHNSLFFVSNRLKTF